MGDSYRPPGRQWARDGMYRFTGNQNDGRRGRPVERRYRPLRNDFRRPNVSERPLLTRQDDVSEWQAFRDPQARDKFRSLADLTDSEEDNMVESDEDSADGAPPAKRPKPADVAGASGTEASVPTTPKWSNPDPYTALPPATETTGKRIGVINLIRKAKIDDANKTDNPDIERNDDFIALDDGLSDIFPQAPTAPRADRLGKRKRGQETAIPPQRGGFRQLKDLDILEEWKPRSSADSAPWHVPCRAEDTASMALHKEIVDFYEWVRPKEYDMAVRADVIRRLSLAFNRVEPGEVKSFGSYAAGLYLPIGDMDLVFLQRSFKPGPLAPNGLPEKPKRKLMERFAKLLRDWAIAEQGSVQLIAFAKVPIIKFVDKVSGLKVDLSFNNDTGVVANETVQQWKAKHPALPILVSLAKQFLMIRGLNDVSVGGLGGFSVICLVTSLLQHMPGSGGMTNLGQLLLEFFNLYGNLFDRESVAIRLDPPGYVDKFTYKPHLFNNEKRNRLAIIDPNRPENNVSGGSNLIDQVFALFSTAHDILSDHLSAFPVSGADKASFSFLKDLVGGDFTAYDKQRKALQSLYFGLTGQELTEPPIRRSLGHHITPSADLPSSAKSNGIPRHDQSAPNFQETTHTHNVIGTKKSRTPKSERRAVLMKLAFPALADTIGSTINMKDALAMSGYTDHIALNERLDLAQDQGVLATALAAPPVPALRENATAYGSVLDILVAITDHATRIRGAVLGLAVCDALGGPVEFQPRGSFPLVTEMLPNGNFNLPAGAFTDDTSMALCLAHSLLDCNGSHNAVDQVERYLDWRSNGYMSSVGYCFDIGVSTSSCLAQWKALLQEAEKEQGASQQQQVLSEAAISSIQQQIYQTYTREKFCGNGSLMRVLPIALIANNNAATTTTTKQQFLVDSLRQMLLLSDDENASTTTGDKQMDTVLISRLLQPYASLDDWKRKPASDIRSTGYVIDSLEAALWAFFSSNTFEEGAIKVVNLGDDADTVGAIYGGLAGAFYGAEAIPARWLEKMLRVDLLDEVVEGIVQYHQREKEKKKEGEDK
ncbi:hypothetical protein DV736_g5889, partial [Chaetothyriales sp. CBS 134916]